MSSRTRQSTVLLLLSLIVGLGLQTAQSDSPADSIATVNGSAISEAEYGSYLIETVGKRPLRGLINRKLAAAEAEKLGIEIEDSAVQAAFDEIWSTLLERWQGDETKAKVELERQGFTVATYRRLVEGSRRHELIVDAICRATREVTQDAIRKRFENEYGPGGKRVEVRHIFLATSRVEAELRDSTSQEPTPASIRAELDRRITELLGNLGSGADFEALARVHSHDKRTHAHGGKLTPEAVSVLGETFDGAVRSAAVGLPTGPVFTANGAHLIEVTSRVTTRFEDVQEQLAEQLKNAPADHAEQGSLENRLFEAAQIEGL